MSQFFQKTLYFVEKMSMYVCGVCNVVVISSKGSHQENQVCLEKSQNLKWKKRLCCHFINISFFGFSIFLMEEEPMSL